MAATGKCTSAFYADISKGFMTRGVSIGGRAVGWPSDEIELLIKGRVAGLNDPQIRAMVDRMHVERAQLASTLQALVRGAS